MKKEKIKIGILGTHGTGKTSLSYLIAHELKKKDKDVGLIQEVVRGCPLPVNESTGLESQLWTISKQVEKEIEVQAKHDYVVTDRTILDNFPI